jgi:hypothetical protein
MPQVEDFLRDLDRRWAPPLPAPLTLRVLGSTALLLQTDYVRGTKDGDVLETPEITPVVSAALLRLGGKETELHVRHRMYLEILAAAFPFLPDAPGWRAVSFDPPLSRLRVEALDVTDVCVAKLARFHRTDRDDIAAMVERGLVGPERLVERFRSAAERWHFDARGDDLPRIIRNLHQVQRDELGVEESEIELPAWLSPD